MSKLHLAERLQLLIELDSAATDAHKRKIGKKLLRLTHLDRKARGLNVDGKKPVIENVEEIFEKVGVDVNKELTKEAYMKLRSEGLNNKQIAEKFEISGPVLSTKKNKEWGLKGWNPFSEESLPVDADYNPPVLREKTYSPSEKHPWRNFKEAPVKEDVVQKPALKKEPKVEDAVEEDKLAKHKFDWDSLKGTVEAISKGFNDIGTGLREPLERASNALHGTKLEDVPLEEESFNAWKEDVIAESTDPEMEHTAQLNDYAPVKEDYNPITPAHYHEGGIDPFTFYAANMTDEMLRGYHVGSAIKYLIRAGKKGDRLEDYQKAQEHIKQLLK